MDELLAISPVNGRYRRYVEELENYFSEFALIKNRVRVEIEFLRFLSKSRIIRKLGKDEEIFLKQICEKFSLKDAKEVKRIEKSTAHDVKAIESFLKRRIEKSSMRDVAEAVHIGLTSEDINNLAHSLALKEAVQRVYIPTLIQLIEKLLELAKRYKHILMLARTHGQPASPTTFGKELINFAYRLAERLVKIAMFRVPGKLTGSVGNLSALSVAFPAVDWIEASKKFVASLGLEPKILTTQILPHDEISDLLHLIASTNNIIVNLDRDLWSYTSYGYLTQRVVKAEVGSTAMPYKVNPVKFESSEGNLELANSMLSLLASKLQITRLQRDLSDSTVKRNYGVALAHAIIGYKSALEGLERIVPNEERMRNELSRHPEVILEAVLAILRREGYKAAYEKLKEFNRGKELTLEGIHKFIKRLSISGKVKSELLNLRPESYTGLAEKLVEIGIGECEKSLALVKRIK